MRLDSQSFSSQHCRYFCCCSLTKLRLTLRHHGLENTRLICPPLSPRVCSNSCPFCQWCHPTISSSVIPSLPDFNLPNEFSNESVLCIRWPKSWSFSFSISLSNEYSGLISFRMDWLDPCSPRDSQESSPTPQFKSINSLALSFMVQLSHPYMTTGKTMALTRWTFVSKVMSAF